MQFSAMAALALPPTFIGSLLSQTKCLLLAHPVLRGIEILPIHKTVDSSRPNVRPVFALFVLAILVPGDNLRECSAQKETNRVAASRVRRNQRDPTLVRYGKTPGSPSDRQ